MLPTRVTRTPPAAVTTARMPAQRDASSDDTSLTHSHTHSTRPSRSPSTSPRTRRVRPVHFFAVIGIYALGFVVWGGVLQGGTNSGLFALFRRGYYDANSNRMLALLNETTESGSQAAGDATTAAAATGYECVGWRHTMACDPNSHVLQSFNRSCNFQIQLSQAGYCAVKSRATGRELRVMKQRCGSLRREVSFTCSQAIDFMHFRLEAEAAIASARAAEPAALAGASSSAGAPEATGRGIVMVVYPKLLVSTYAVVRTLRESLNCSLPIEIWYLESEMGANATSNAVLQVLTAAFAPLTLVAVADPHVTGFNSKVHAILHTNLSDVLFLDADNVPVRDPTYLFDSLEYQRTGALFWPDFWHPAHSIFKINTLSLLWELLGMDFIDMFEQESGQLLINRRKSFVALQTLRLFAFRQPNHFETLMLAWGDKDLFRLAWLKSNSSFHMIESPPAVAGSLVQGKFCGMSMVQFDPAGDVVFLHRNAMKLNGGRPALGKAPDTEVWTHLQTFVWGANVSAISPNATTETMDAATVAALVAADPTNRTAAHELLKEFYRVTIYDGAPEYPPTQSCYGQPWPQLEANWRTVPWSETGLESVEKKLLRFAKDGVALLPVENIIMVST